MSSVGAVSGASNEPVRSAGEDAFGAMSTEDFMAIMFAELEAQDPTAPTDSSELLNQISTIRSIESDVGLGESIEALVKQNEVTSAGGMVGSFVTGRGSGGAEIAGFVDSVSVTRDGVLLNLSSGAVLSMDDLTEIVDPALVRAGPGNAAPEVLRSIEGQSASVGTPFTFTVPADTFGDDTPGDELRFSASLEDGTALPAWLTFNASSRSFSGTPGEDNAGDLVLRVTATDRDGESASTTFRLSIGGG